MRWFVHCGCDMCVTVAHHLPHLYASPLFWPYYFHVRISDSDEGYAPFCIHSLSEMSMIRHVYICFAWLAICSPHAFFSMTAQALSYHALSFQKSIIRLLVLWYCLHLHLKGTVQGAESLAGSVAGERNRDKGAVAVAAQERRKSHVNQLPQTCAS